MPIKRGPDGKIEIIETQKGDGGNAGPTAAPGGGNQNQGTDKIGGAPAGGGAAAPAGQDALYKPTDAIGRGGNKQGVAQAPGTNIAGRRKSSDAAATGGAADPMDDPIAGWLVVIDGPGQGNVLHVGYGVNSIGRDDDARIALGFGDDEISRKDHAIVTYDPKGKGFFLQHGSGKNLTYLNDAPVLQPTELPAGSHITMGSTVLRFVPFCGPDFDWQSNS